jgi:cytidylate kinase
MAVKVTQIVEEQIKAWEYQNSRNISPHEKKTKYPVITISREFGARGAALAELLGQRMDFEVWDKELLQAIAEELGSDQKLLETLDERRQQDVEDTVAGFMDDIYTNVKYLRSLIRVVKTIEEHGRSFIVGRGANYICQNPKSFHVRVVCPFKTRVTEYAKRENIGEKKAHEIIKQKDNERAEFIKRNFYRDVTNQSDYDLILNSKTFTLEQITDMVLDAYEKKLGQKVKLPG